MIKIVCNRCGRELPRPTVITNMTVETKYEIKSVNPILGEEQVDLCPDCMERFKIFLHNPEVDNL